MPKNMLEDLPVWEKKSFPDDARQPDAAIKKYTGVLLQALEWLVFDSMWIVMVPTVIGPAIGLDRPGMASLSQRLFFFTGLASLLQVTTGHKMPIFEGPAALWWALIIGMGNAAAVRGYAPELLRGSLEMGLIISGAVLALMSLTGLTSRIMKLFTPVVTGSVLVMVALQLSGSIIKGVIGVGFLGQPLSPVAIITSLAVIGIITFLSLKGNRLIKSLSVLAGIVAGWLGMALAGYADLPRGIDFTSLAVPRLLTWGKPAFDGGMVLTCVIAGVVLIPNVVASIVAMGEVTGVKVNNQVHNRGVFFNGVANILAGLGATVGSVPTATSAGFARVTGMTDRLPFILACGLLIFLGFQPAIGMILASIPGPVSNAAMLVTACTLFIFGLQEYARVKFTDRETFVVGIAILAGTGIMFLPANTFKALPVWISYLASNGTIVSMLVCIFLEHIVFPNRKKFN
ncbi:Putative purine permease YwdJ [Neomoorella glycerini]|uniref:Purine permease YwdJ n=1 Tax=Neomoorella glycerini TaxID=55779 RepID=A0A6I5ZUS1_9FIRM|nr:purine/pyrimidine permease [Moorella glycerini]QGP93141.1 Putative purine permease YwdJ [Moorella glycerini]